MADFFRNSFLNMAAIIEKIFSLQSHYDLLMDFVPLNTKIALKNFSGTRFGDINSQFFFFYMRLCKRKPTLSTPSPKLSYYSFLI